MSALSKVTSLEEVAWGIGLVAVTMIIHAFAMPTTLAACSIVERRGQNRGGFFAGALVLLLASGLIVITHLVEVVVWAVFFVVRDAFPDTSAAFYYSLLQYTTAGSDLSLPDRWRLLGGMIAIAGVLAFAWSTAVLLLLAQRFQHQQLKRMSVDAPVDPE